MNAENTRKLITEFPTMFKPDPTFKSNLMAFGFECGDGWFDIIYKLCRKLKELEWDGTVTQVKEKYGTLRFYVDSGNDEVYKAIDLAEEESSRTCEECGKPGVTGPGKTGWILTLCRECRKKN